MDIQIGKNENEWVNLAWTWLNSEVKPGQRVFIPSGDTPLALYRKWNETPTELIKSLKLLQLDEIITGPLKGSFHKFFVDHMGRFGNQFEWVGQADKTADVAVLGVGINGHVAFHEPGVPRSFYGGCVKLTPETRQYLRLNDMTWAVTYGAAVFERCQKILVLARGERKKTVIERALRDRDLPISWILQHPRVTMVTDFPIAADIRHSAVSA